MRTAASTPRTKTCSWGPRVEAAGGGTESRQDDASGRALTPFRSVHGDPDAAKKSIEAVAAPAAGRLSPRPVPVQRTACLSGLAYRPRHLSLQEPPKTMGRTACSHPGDRTEPGSVWISEDPGSAAKRRLASGQAPGVSAVQGRGPGLEEEASEAAQGSAAPRRTVPADGSGPSLKPGFRGRSAAGWKTLSFPDDRRCLHPGECCDRSWTEPQRRRRGTNIEQTEA